MAFTHLIVICKNHLPNFIRKSGILQSPFSKLPVRTEGARKNNVRSEFTFYTVNPHSSSTAHTTHVAQLQSTLTHTKSDFEDLTQVATGSTFLVHIVIHVCHGGMRATQRARVILFNRGHA